MATKVWFEDDIKNALSATALAAEVLASSSSQEQGYVEGFCAAIRVIGTAFGIHHPTMNSRANEYMKIEEPLRFLVSDNNK